MNQDRFKETIKEYLDIAKGDRALAKQFFEKAYSDAEFSFDQLAPEVIQS